MDHEGKVLESFVTKERDKASALKFIKKALERHGSPKAVATDGLRSYGAAMRELGEAEKREVGRWANNRVENSRSEGSVQVSATNGSSSAYRTALIRWRGDGARSVPAQTPRITAADGLAESVALGATTWGGKRRISQKVQREDDDAR